MLGNSLLPPKFFFLCVVPNFEYNDAQRHTLYVDAIKAFDLCDRKMPWPLLLRKGVPAALIHQIKELYRDCKTSIKIGEEESVMDSTARVKQGDPIASLLFTFIVNSAVESAPWPAHVKAPSFKHCSPDPVSGVTRWDGDHGKDQRRRHLRTVRLGRPKCSSFLAPDAQKLLPPVDAEEDFGINMCKLHCATTKGTLRKWAPCKSSKR